MLNCQEEQAYLIATGQGDRAAFSAIVKAYQRPIYNLCYQMLNDTAEVEDAVQEVFLRAYLKLESYDTARKFSTWLFSIASHYCLDRLKKRRLQTVSLSLLPAWRIPTDDAPKLEQQVIQMDNATEIQWLLGQLPAKQRMVVVMYYWHSMSIAEIAEAMKMSGGAIKSQLFRARKRMGQMMQPVDGGIGSPRLASMNV